VNVDREYRVFILDSDMARVVAFLGASAPKSFDLYVRDNATDMGADCVAAPGAECSSRAHRP